MEPNCAQCQQDTVGNHESWCPLRKKGKVMENGYCVCRHMRNEHGCALNDGSYWIQKCALCSCVNFIEQAQKP